MQEQHDQGCGRKSSQSGIAFASNLQEVTDFYEKICQETDIVKLDYVIVDSLLEMCRRLGYDSIIEGVENSNVADIEGELNATLLQGYHYSRLVCREDFEKLLDEDRAISIADYIIENNATVRQTAKQYNFYRKV